MMADISHGGKDVNIPCMIDTIQYRYTILQCYDVSFNMIMSDLKLIEYARMPCRRTSFIAEHLWDDLARRMRQRRPPRAMLKKFCQALWE